MTASTAPAPALQEISDGVFAYVQLDGSWFLNNAGFLVGSDGVTVVDSTSTERRARALVAAIDDITDKPKRVLINTHHHGDHTHGNYLFPAAAIIGHERCRAEVLAAGVGTSALFGDVEWGDLRVAAPFVTFRDRITIHVDDLAMELVHTGPAHTTNDVYAWVPDRGVLFAGDLLFNGVTPLLAMGSIAGTRAALAELRALGATTIVPGHGSVCGPSAIDDVERYVTLIGDTAMAGHTVGISPLEVARHTELGDFAAWADPERLVANLHRAYAEIDGAAPGDPLDLRGAFRDMVTIHGGPLRCLA